MRGRFFVSQIVQVETVWVLESAYNFEKPAIIHLLSHLLQNRVFSPQREEVFQKALESYRTGAPIFPII